ncbi:MAG: DUF2156 domain-containing protein [Candidatus Hodarchaeota archaeon]
MNLSLARQIEIEDKKLFDGYFEKSQPEISEFTFTNLFIWKDYYSFLFLESDNHLIVFSHDYFKNWKKSISNLDEGTFFLTPIGPEPEKLIMSLFKQFDNIEIHRVPKDVIEKVIREPEYQTLNLDIQEDRVNWDYIYEIESLINLPGNKFRQKRRWLNTFLESYNYEFNIISDDLIDKALKLQLEWCDQNECQTNEDLIEEQKAIKIALENFNELGIYGGIIGVDNKCVAYTLGEMINQDTLVIHIEKAHIEYEGSYQAINNLFLKEFGQNVKYVNREQDLGIPGLRRAKEAYKPIRMVEKSIIYHREE